MRPVADDSVFGYCENCGLVYALRSRLKEDWSKETPRNPRTGPKEEPGGLSSPSAATHFDAEIPAQPTGSHWRCPDCDAEMSAANDSDLGFVKREHIREYHPNRSTS